MLPTPPENPKAGEAPNRGVMPAPVIDFAEMFGRVAPVELDLGCGDGAYLAQLAQAFPETNFLGVERLVGRVRSARWKLSQQALENARVLEADTPSAVRERFPTGAVACIHIMFPDPWPKRRHHRRRLLDEGFLRALHRVLQADGMLRIATDDGNYFRAISDAIDQTNDLFAALPEEPSVGPVSTFEQRYRDLDCVIYRVRLRKISGVR